MPHFALSRDLLASASARARMGEPVPPRWTGQRLARAGHPGGAAASSRSSSARPPLGVAASDGDGAWQPARGRHRRPHGLPLVVGAGFLRALRRYGALGDGWACRRASWPLSRPRSGGAKSRRRGPCAQPVRPARAWFRSPSSASLTDSSATVYVAGVVLGLGSLGAGGDRRLAVALVSFRCLTCLFDGCLTIL